MYIESFATTPVILSNSMPLLLHTISTLLVMPLTAATLHCNVRDCPTVGLSRTVTLNSLGAGTKIIDDYG